MRPTLLVLFSTLVLSRGYSQARLAITEGAKSSVFMQDSASTPNEESTPTFMPDGKTVYLANNGAICLSKKVGDHWTKPVPISFTTGKYKDWDPTLSPDGKRLLFVSNRTYTAADGSTKAGNHLWMSRLIGGGWSEPQHLDSPVNKFGFVNYGPSISAAGTICFCSRDRDGNKGMRAYLCRWAGDHYEKPELLVLNGAEPTFDPYIAPDERYILFSSNNALYISYRTGQGWSPGEKLGPEVNDAAKAGMLWGPSISRDGKTLYYSGGTSEGIAMIPVRWMKG